MLTSYNGWSASPRPADFGGIVPLVVAGESFIPGVRAGDVHTIFQYLAERLHAEVEPVYREGWHAQDDWGYNYRLNRNAGNLSCHASGTAIDYNATRHPNGRRGTFTPEQVLAIRRILADLDGVVRWGGDFLGTPDEMHWEIIGSGAAVARVAARIRRAQSGPAPRPAPGVRYEKRANARPGSRTLSVGKVGPDVAFVQRWHGIKPDEHYGPVTAAKVRETQRRNRVAADGVVGPVTWRLLGVGAPRRAPAFPLPAGHYYGPLTGPARSHGGFYAHERDEVAAIQRALIERGHVPGVRDWRKSGWDDGRYGQPTVDAVKRFQRAHRLAVDGLVGPKTWAALLAG